jgi:hypothetical protein
MLLQKWTGDDYTYITSSEDEDTSYDLRAREGTVVDIAPILDRVVSTNFNSVLWLNISPCYMSSLFCTMQGSSVMQFVHDIDNTLRYPIGSPGNERRMREMLEV